MLKDQRIVTQLQERVKALEPNIEYSAEEWFGEGWELLGSPGYRKTLGTNIHTAVDKGVITGMEFTGIRSRGRCNIYRRVAD